MTKWKPELEENSRPKYLALADLIARDVKSGRLRNGARLPTHRELAERLGVTVGTVTRGYEEARRRGLVAGEVGRGTFVRRGRLDGPQIEGPTLHQEGVVDLGINMPCLAAARPAFQAAIEELSKRRDLDTLLQYQPFAGILRHREAGALWLKRLGVTAHPDEILITSGAQHAVVLALSVLAEPGDLVLSEALTYPGVKAATRFLRLRLEGVAIDDEGVIPSAFEEACRKRRAKVMYLTPTLQNPTATIMPKSRREEIVDIANRHGVTLIEDDIYSFLADKAPPPLVACAGGENGLFVSSLSKSIAPGLRVGFIRAPRTLTSALTSAVMATVHMASPLTAEIATLVLEGTLGARIMKEVANETASRMALARELFGSLVSPKTPWTGPHFWLPIPEPWRTEEFVKEARARGVLVASSEAFAVGRDEAPHGIRVSVGSPEQRSSLEHGLRVLKGLLGETPPPALAGP